MNPFEGFSISRNWLQGNAYALAMASQLAYEAPRQCERTALQWGLDCQFFEVGDTQAITLEGSNFIVLAFRGTESIEDIKTDARFRRRRFRDWGAVHRGFLEAFEELWLGEPGLRKSLVIDQVFGKRLFVTGHSLGGALAQICAAALCFELLPPIVYTFGSPRVGDWIFARALNRFVGLKIYRHENNNDVVPRVPPALFGYRHAGERFYLTERGQVIGSPHWWTVLKDRLWGRLRDFGKPGTDGTKDHGIARYCRALEN